MKKSYELRMEKALVEDSSTISTKIDKTYIIPNVNTDYANLSLPFWLFLILIVILLNSQYSFYLLAIVFTGFFLLKYQARTNP